MSLIYAAATDRDGLPVNRPTHPWGLLGGGLVFAQVGLAVVPPALLVVGTEVVNTIVTTREVGETRNFVESNPWS